MSHHSTICKHCRRVVSTCRCPSKNKPKNYVDTCPTCMGAPGYRKTGSPKTFLEAVQAGEAIPEDLQNWVAFAFKPLPAMLGLTPTEYEVVMRTENGLREVLHARGITTEVQDEDRDSPSQ